MLRSAFRTEPECVWEFGETRTSAMEPFTFIWTMNVFTSYGSADERFPTYSTWADINIVRFLTSMESWETRFIVDGEQSPI